MSGVCLAGMALVSAVRSRKGQVAPAQQAPETGPQANEGEIRNDGAAIGHEDALDRSWENGETASQVSAMFDALGDMFAVLSPEGRILRANSIFQAACATDTPVGCTLAEAGMEVEETETGYQLRTVSHGKPRVWAWRQTPFRSTTEGLVTHIVGRDVTSEKEAEALLFDAKAKAESANEAKTRFLATVSHEIRTPLNGILGMTHLLGQTEVTPEQASYLKTVKESGHSLLQLIEDLLDATSIEAGHFHLREVECNPRELVQASCELMAAQAHEKGVEIASHVSLDTPETIISDPGRIRQILFNLIGNAIKFTAEGGILVEVERQQEWLALHVNDTGPGLKAEDQARIFNEFERADNSTTRRHGGAGLGLSITSRIVTALGGRISLDSEPGKGSRFSVLIPLRAEKETSSLTTTYGEMPLKGRSAVILAPAGPGADTLVRTIAEFGGTALQISDAGELADTLKLSGADKVTDLLVDRRLSQQDPEGMRAVVGALGDDVAKTVLIAPEDSRDLALAPELEAGKWLVRPVRAASLIDVLTRRDDRSERDRASGTAATPDLMRPSNAPTFDILLAEDNPVNALVVRTLLARQGHRVTLVENGKDLVNRALDRPEQRCRYDLVITDISMPEVDGREAIERIRAIEAAEQLGKLPILVLSADGQAQTCDALMALGANGYAEKPIDPEWLSSLVNLTGAEGRKAREA